MSKFVAIAVVLLILLALVPKVQSAPVVKVQVIADSLNIYTWPNTDSAVLETVKKGSKIIISGKDDSGYWFTLKYGDGTGWIYSVVPGTGDPAVRFVTGSAADLPVVNRDDSLFVAPNTQSTPASMYEPQIKPDTPTAMWPTPTAQPVQPTAEPQQVAVLPVNKELYPKTYSQHGVSFSYPANWSITPNIFGLIDINNGSITMFPTIPITSGTTSGCLNPSLPVKGITDVKTTNFVVLPGGLFSQTTIDVNGQRLALYQYTSGSSMAECVEIKMSDTTVLAVLADFSSDNPLAKGFIESIRVSQPEASQWWVGMPNPTSVGNFCFVEQNSTFQGMLIAALSSTPLVGNRKLYIAGRVYEQHSSCDVYPAFLSMAYAVFGTNSPDEFTIESDWSAFFWGWKDAESGQPAQPVDNPPSDNPPA